MQDASAETVSLWVAAAQSGSTKAFNQLYRRFVRLVHGVLLSRFVPAVAEELTQECFLIAFRKLGQLRDRERFGPWLTTIARRIDAPADRRSASEELIESVPDPAPGPEIAADAERVLAAIRALPAPYRETLVLRLVEGMSGPEIAAATGLDPDSVRVNLHRGMRKLRVALGVTPDEPNLGADLYG
jgi:RNA polymerase sigma-70 factor (ECF subfamily)